MLAATECREVDSGGTKPRDLVKAFSSSVTWSGVCEEAGIIEKAERGARREKLDEGWSESFLSLPGAPPLSLSLSLSSRTSS